MQIHFDHPHFRLEDPNLHLPLAHRPMIHPALCRHCGTCAAFCHMGAIVSLDMNGQIGVHPERCAGCGMCVRVCPEHAIEMVEIGRASVAA